MQTLQLPSGKEIPILGQGTWRMGEKASQKQSFLNNFKYFDNSNQMLHKNTIG